MRLGIFSDVHGNLEALQAVLAAADDAQCGALVCLGDVVGYGPDPGPCVELLQQRDVKTLRGNHDEAAAEDLPLDRFNRIAESALLWTRTQLTPGQRRWLRGLALVHIAPSWRSTFVHASLNQPELYRYVDNVGAATDCLDCSQTACCFVGHTHLPMVLALGGSNYYRDTLDRVRVEAETQYLFNVGSAGQPRDGDCRSALVLFDTGSGSVEMRRVEYDVAMTQKKMMEAGLPGFLWRRLAAGV
jgi:diadenosine tetraphosphatase ApaH/serine/threonine PP2A family protein phosphatase